MDKYWVAVALEEVAPYLVKDLKENCPVDTGKLKNSIDYYIKDNVLYVTMEDYGQIVNDGSAPHIPPISAIEGWSKRKGLKPWAVAKNIEKFGTKPTFFMKNLEEFEKNYYEKLNKSLYNEAEAVIWETLQKIKK